MPEETLTVKPADELPAPGKPGSSPLKVGFVSLGCPKNLVDSEVMMGMLAQAGAELIPRADDADVIVVNTCSFIDSAQQESVNTILEMARHKTHGRAQKLVVAGCLVERYRDEIRKNIPEVDAVVGTGRTGEYPGSGRCSPGPGFAVPHPAIPPRRRRPRRPRPLLARSMGRRHRRSSQLSLRRNHSPRSGYRRATPLISRLPKDAIIPAASASFRSCVDSFARGASSR